MKRQLNKEEKNLCERRKDALLAEIDWMKYQIEYHNLMIEKGLKLNFDKTMRDLKVQKRDFENQIKSGEETIRVLDFQIKEGVDEKDMKGNEIKTKGGK
jgi:hypothetical protein